MRVLLGAVNGAIALDRCGLLDAGRLDTELARIVVNDVAPDYPGAESIIAEVARRYQTTVEALAGVRLHKQNFRRLVERNGLVEGTGKRATSTGGRPAELFRFRPAVVEERPRPGLGVPYR